MVIVRFVAVAGEYDDSLLTPAERARLGRLRDPADRAAYAAAHLLVRSCAAELLGRAPVDVPIAQRCAHCGGEDHGAPYVPSEPDVVVSLSHTRGFVAAVAARGRCGIDVERLPASVPRDALSEVEAADVARSLDPDREAARLWVRKEAVAKATGQDLIRPQEVVEPPGLVVRDWAAGGALGAWAVGAWAEEQS